MTRSLGTSVSATERGAKKIWVGDQRILVAGEKVDHLRNARAEAVRASKLISRALGRTVPVSAALVFVAVAEITTRSKPRDVHIFTERNLLRSLRKLKPTMTLEAVAAITEVAIRPSTWTSRPVAPVRHSLLDDFAAPQREEIAAVWVRRGWWIGSSFAALIAARPFALGTLTRMFTP